MEVLRSISIPIAISIPMKPGTRPKGGDPLADEEKGHLWMETG